MLLTNILFFSLHYSDIFTGSKYDIDLRRSTHEYVN